MAVGERDTLADADVPAVAVRAVEAAYKHSDAASRRAPRFPDTHWGRLRANTGWSLRELSARSGVNLAELSRIERGLGPRPEHAWRILRSYGWTDEDVR